MGDVIHISVRGQKLFEARVHELRRLGMDDEHVTRQIVDDYYRQTGNSIHDKQHVIEAMVRSVPRVPSA